MMFSDHLFLVLDQNDDHVVTADEFCTLEPGAVTEGEFHEYALRAAIAIDAHGHCLHSLREVAAVVCPSDFEPMTLLEFQTATVLRYCNDEIGALVFLLNRGATIPWTGCV
jgi:hypothetical protein